VNPGQPFNGLNWGHLYTDRANTPIFNSGVLTVQRPLDAKSETFDYGFKVQGMVGEDMRYNHYMGELDYAIPSRTQIGPIEAHGLMHIPLKTSVTEGGIDLKVGQFVTMNGAELITAKDNLFYSHAYMFNFGPFVDTGVMVTTHSKSWLDIYTGIITGNNMSIGWPGDNNNGVTFHGGFGFNLLDGDLVIMAITTTGPENPKQTDKYGSGWSTGYFANGMSAGGVGAPFMYPQGPEVTGLPFTSNMSAWGVPGQCACDDRHGHQLHDGLRLEPKRLWCGSEGLVSDQWRDRRSGRHHASLWHCPGKTDGRHSLRHRSERLLQA
jgi:hypothetical protein